MSSTPIVVHPAPPEEFQNPWTLDSEEGLWSFTDPAPELLPYFPYVSGSNRITEVYSRPLAKGEERPSTESAIQVTLDSDTSQNLGEATELRFWLRSSLPANGSNDLPFYLAFQVFNSDRTWRRLLPVRQPHQWELHQLWLGDMPATLRGEVATIRLSSLNQNPDIALVNGFTAAIGDVIGVTSEPVQDVEAALGERLAGLQIEEITGLPDVPVIVAQPEDVAAALTIPYILIVPWSVQNKGELGGSIELVDNYCQSHWEDDVIDEHLGAYVRSPLSQLQLEYAIDVYTQERHQKRRLFDAILNRFSQRPFLLVNGQRFSLLSFEPPPERMAEFASEGHRTPLFYQVTIPIETGDRRFVPYALHPILPLGQRTMQPTAEGYRLESDRTSQRR